MKLFRHQRFKERSVALSYVFTNISFITAEVRFPGRLSGYTLSEHVRNKKIRKPLQNSALKEGI
jgi:hypothetical protein